MKRFKKLQVQVPQKRMGLCEYPTSVFRSSQFDSFVQRKWLSMSSTSNPVNRTKQTEVIMKNGSRKPIPFRGSDNFMTFKNHLLDIHIVTTS